ncbi:hypothetical protein AAEO57_05345, partial [Flavobacterium sp. DGU38]
DKVEMEFLLMAIGHNFRKMVANNNKKHNTHIKFSMRVRNRGVEVEIYLFKIKTEYFFIKQPTQNQSLKFAA